MITHDTKRGTTDARFYLGVESGRMERIRKIPSSINLFNKLQSIVTFHCEDDKVQSSGTHIFPTL